MTEEIRLKEGIMAEEVRVVEHYSASIANKVGEGARVLGALRDGGVNLIAFWGYKHGEGRALSAKSEETQPKNSPQEEQQVRASFARVARGRLDSLQNDFLPDTLQPSDFLHICAPHHRTQEPATTKVEK